MTRAVHIGNAAVTWVLDALLAPFGPSGPWLGLAALALASGALSVWLWARLTDAAAVRRSRDRLQAQVLGLRLYQQDVRVLLGIQAAMLRAAAAHTRHAVAPVALLVGPVLLALVHLEGRCGLRALDVGESVLVTVRGRHAGALGGAIALGLDPGEGLAVETPALRLPAAGEAVWRVRALRPGRHVVTVRVGAQTAAKEVAVGRGIGRVSPVRTGAGWWALLRHPGEPPLPAGGAILAVLTDYPRRPLGRQSWGVSWLVVFAVLSIGSGWLCKRRWKVEM